MNADALVLHLQHNGIAYFVGAMVVIPLIVVFRKYSLPFLFHVGEYLVYCALAHVMISGLTRAFSWFRGETSFKNYAGELEADFVPFTTPLNLNFWQRELYSPEWLFWFECGVAALLLYVVIFLRPVKFRNKTYESRKPKPGNLSAKRTTPRAYRAATK